MLYYRARYYSPFLGRFMQADPVGYTADLNLYTYGANDPADKSDPIGKDPFNVPPGYVEIGPHNEFTMKPEEYHAIMQPKVHVTASAGLSAPGGTAGVAVSVNTSSGFHVYGVTGPGLNSLGIDGTLTVGPGDSPTNGSRSIDITASPGIAGVAVGIDPNSGQIQDVGVSFGAEEPGAG